MSQSDSQQKNSPLHEIHNLLQLERLAKIQNNSSLSINAFSLASIAKVVNFF